MVSREEVSKGEGFAWVCFGTDIADVFCEFELSVYSKVTVVIEMNDMNVVNDDISRLLMRLDGENDTFRVVIISIGLVVVSTVSYPYISSIIRTVTRNKTVAYSSPDSCIVYLFGCFGSELKCFKR